MSSSRKKVLVGGTIASLALSLALPISSHFGSSSVQQAEAAVGPKFKKPWYVKPDGLSFKKTKSYPIPDELQYNNRGVRSEFETIPDDYEPPQQTARPATQPAPSQPVVSVPVPKPATESPLMQELQKLYEENGADTAEMQAPPAAPEVAKKENRKSRKNGEQEQESRGLLNRLFNNFNGDKAPSTVQEPAQPDAAVVDSELPNAPGSRSKQGAGLPFELPMPDSPAVADIIVPPQPQPNLLPGVDLTKPEAYQPETVSTPAGKAMNDPFPLPPLPDGFSSGNKVASDTNAEAKTGGFVLPPLPGVGTSPEEKTASVETPQPLTEESVVTNDTAVIEMEPEPIVSVEVAPEQSPAVEPQLAERTSSANGKKKNQLPMAPSAQVDESWLNREVKQAEQHAEVKAAELPPSMQGWRSRTTAEQQTVPAPVDFAPAETVEESVLDAQPAPLPPLVDEPSSTAEPMPEAEVEPKLTIEPEATVAQSNPSVNPKHVEPKPLPMPEQARPAEIPAETNAAEPDSKADKYRRIAERGERTGFKGFCPVALKDSLDLVDASPEFRSEFEGQIYYFSSRLAKEKFDFDPFRYSPAQGGIDLVKYLEQGTQEPGRLDYAVWYQDRLFLFSNPQTLEKFRADPAEFVKGE